jgi:hypothetical protein
MRTLPGETKKKKKKKREKRETVAGSGSGSIRRCPTAALRASVPNVLQ